MEPSRTKLSQRSLALFRRLRRPRIDRIARLRQNWGQPVMTRGNLSRQMASSENENLPARGLRMRAAHLTRGRQGMRPSPRLARLHVGGRSLRAPSLSAVPVRHSEYIDIAPTRTRPKLLHAVPLRLKFWLKDHQCRRVFWRMVHIVRHLPRPDRETHSENESSKTSSCGKVVATRERERV